MPAFSYGSLPRPTIFAHRGASAHAPENTLAAFKMAVDSKAPAIELDAKLTSDGEIVVIHDHTVDRTTNGSGAVRQFPLKVLQTLDAGAFFHRQFTGEKIPTLGEVFETVGGKVFINIEITNYASPFDDLPIKVAELVLQYNLQDTVLFSSFFASNLRRAHKIAPKIPMGLLTFSGLKGLVYRSWLGFRSPFNAIHPEAGDVTVQWIARVHHAHRRVHAYTVNNPDQMRLLFVYGIDGIFTDDPLLAQQVLAESLDNKS
jgi:glycerophosphoryl diester phosphodiesterase